ncbi:adenine deaminase [Lasius niger]|uniref:Adenine deaminase n=1 Tax=Lasius niger TaxID=67767 RepID=A0A0J7MPN4_LASNI|nr:adenine deaminase [Lasius niger]
MIHWLASAGNRNLLACRVLRFKQPLVAASYAGVDYFGWIMPLVQAFLQDVEGFGHCELGVNRLFGFCTVLHPLRPSDRVKPVW